jgi:hypothetical protein
LTTWAAVDLSSADFSGVADAENGYVAAGYSINDYLDGAVIWAGVDDQSTTWSAA